MTIEAQIPIYKITKCIFQIGDLNNVNENFLKDFISIIDLGMKFIPSIFNSYNAYILFILNKFDKNFFSLNRNIFFYKKNMNREINRRKQTNIQENKLDEYLEHLNKINKKSINTNTNNIPLQKEALYLRNNLIEKLSSNEFKIYRNLSFEQINCIKEFRKNKPFKVVNCDKNVGWAIIDNNLYNKIGLEYLEKNKNYFKPLNNNPSNETIEKIEKDLDSLCKNGHITEKIRKNLSVIDPKIGKLNLLPKLHKSVFGNRPIISNVKHCTSNMSIFINLILQLFVQKNKTYIKDAQNLIQLIYKIFVDESYELTTGDFESLYTMMDSEDAIERLTQYYAKYIKYVDLSNYGFNKILKLVFYNNIFCFNRKYYIQTNGLSMGTSCGPTVANLYLYLLEMDWVELNKPLVYYRFIDDIFIIDKNLDKENLKEQFPNLKLNMVSGKNVQFLDLDIKINNITNRLEFCQYIKPTNSFQYLKINSNHPNNIFKNIPKSLFIRLRRICSEYSEYLAESRELIIKLVSRGYDFKTLSKLRYIIGSIDLEKLIPYKEKKEYCKNNKINCKIIFDFNYIDIKKDLNNFFNSIVNNETCKHFNFINVTQNNLFKILNYNNNINFFNKYKTSSCDKCCNCIYASNSYNINTKNYNIPITCNENCKAINCIYILKCAKCDVLYIGQTNNFYKRLCNHISMIKNYYKIYNSNNCCIEVAKHFNTCNHNIKEDLKFYIFKNNIKSNEIRRFIENDLINICIKLNIKIINDYIPMHYKCKSLCFA